MPSISATPFIAETLSSSSLVASSLLRQSFAAFSHGVSKLSASGSAYISHAIHQAILARDLDDTDMVDNDVIFGARQRRNIQIVAACMACVSITAATVAIYWFCLMRRNYRRDLVLMLILSDFFKSLCYLIHGAVNFGRGQVQSQDTFCQASGFMLQTGLDACDIAILFISVHMGLQMFPMPKTIFGYNGLYNVRYWVLAIWLIMPGTTAALAFINPEEPYQAQGPWCWLPVRPFWYRLALSWIPRYLIFIVILGLAIRIYFHVGSEFKLFAAERGRTASAGSDLGWDTVGILPDASCVPSTHMGTDGGSDTALASTALQSHRQPPPVWNSRFTSPASHGGFGPSVTSNFPEAPMSPHLAPAGQQTSSIEAVPSHQADGGWLSAPGGNMNVTAKSSRNGSLALAVDEPSVLIDTIDGAMPANGQSMDRRRRAIQRQVRILFVYPIAYVTMWLVPFIVHCMNYNDYWATHPAFGVALVSSLCQTSLGFVDVAVFCWRERPWRHISGSNGTFLGSFAFWRFRELPSWLPMHNKHPDTGLAISRAEEQATDEKGWFRNLLNPLHAQRLGSNAQSNRSADQQRSDTRTQDFASGNPQRDVMHSRLAPEPTNGEYRQTRGSGEGRRASQARVISPTPSALGRRDWFDRQISSDEESSASSNEQGDESNGTQRQTT